MKGLRPNIIVKNLPLHRQAKEDEKTADQTRQVVRAFLKELKLDRVPVEFAKRFRSSPAMKGKGPPPVQIVLEKTSDKAQVFRALDGSKLDKIYKRISVTNEYPACLRADIREAEKQAYEIRNDGSGKKTKIVVREGKVQIMTKNKNDRQSPFVLI